MIESKSLRNILFTVKQLWLAYLLASILILCGFSWSLHAHDKPYSIVSFHADEVAAVTVVNRIDFPRFDPQWLPWGTALFYQVALVRTVLKNVLHLLNLYSGQLDALGLYHIGRFVIYIYALGIITMVFILGRKLFDTWTARLAAIILAVIPGFVINSHYFKTDIPMMFWLLTAVFVAYQLISTGKFKYVLLLGTLVGYSASVKYSAALFFPVGFIAISMADGKLKKRSCWIYYSACVAGAFIFGTPYALLDFDGLIDALKWVSSINRAGIPYYMARPPGWIDYPLNVLPFSLTVPMLLLVPFAVLWACIKKGKILLPIWTFLLLYYIMMGYDNCRLTRYTIPLLPFIALFIAFLIRSLKQVRHIRPIAVSGIYIIIAYAFVFSLSYVQVMAKTDTRVLASRWIEKNIPDDFPIPIISTHYLNVPQIELIGYEKLEIDYSIAQLQNAQSQYLILSEFGPSFYLEAIEHYPQKKAFFDYLEDKYSEVVHFEHSQKLLGIDSKRKNKLPQDWLHPNPRITIVKKR